MNKIIKIYLEKPEITAFLLLLFLSILFENTSEGVFFDPINIQGMMNLLPEMLLVAVGVTLLMICGEFDLSVGSVFAFMPMLIVILLNQGFSFVPAILLSIFCAGGIGFLNGYISLKFNLPSFITTLGMLFIVRSLTIIISGGFPPLIPEETPLYIFTYDLGFFRISMLWFLSIAIIVIILLEKTNFGNWVRGSGGQSESARALGIPVRKTKIICFILSAVIAGFAGTLQVFRLESPLPSLGEGLELQAVAASVIGGTALTGGIGSIMGGIIGALLIRVIDNGLVLSSVDANWFKFAVGSLTIGAVVVNLKFRQWGNNIKVEIKK